LLTHFKKEGLQVSNGQSSVSNQKGTQAGFDLFSTPLLNTQTTMNEQSLCSDDEWMNEKGLSINRVQ
jgi:hypothetical protein